MNARARCTRLTWAWVLVAVAGVGCAKRSVPDTLDPARKRLGSGEYRGLDLGNHIVVYATGVHPSSGYRVTLDVLRRRGRVPELALYEEPPRLGEGVTGGFTPFTVSVAMDRRWFPRVLPTVTVHDERGEHAVEVREPPRAADDAPH